VDSKLYSDGIEKLEGKKNDLVYPEVAVFPVLLLRIAAVPPTAPPTEAPMTMIEMRHRNNQNVDVFTLLSRPFLGPALSMLRSTLSQAGASAIVWIGPGSLWKTT
jgi:hypothetical protein